MNTDEYRSIKTIVGGAIAPSLVNPRLTSGSLKSRKFWMPGEVTI